MDTKQKQLQKEINTTTYIVQCGIFLLFCYLSIPAVPNVLPKCLMVAIILIICIIMVPCTKSLVFAMMCFKSMRSSR